MPANLLALFGGHSDIVPLLDGEAHARRKRSLLAAFSREAVASYMPGLQRRIETLLGKWLAKGQGPVTAELKTLAIESLAGAIFGLEPGEELTRLLADNAILAKAFVALPINLPGTAYTKGLQARDRILALLEERRAPPVDSPPAPPDGLVAHPCRRRGGRCAARPEDGRVRDAPFPARRNDRLRRAGSDAARAARASAGARAPARRGARPRRLGADRPGPAARDAVPDAGRRRGEADLPERAAELRRAKSAIDVAGYTIPQGHW